MAEAIRFPAPRNAGKRLHAASEALHTSSTRAMSWRVFLSRIPVQSRFWGSLQPLHTGPQTVALGFISQGGPLDTAGMLFVNRCTWAHIVAEVIQLLDLAGEDLLSVEEWAVIEGKRAP